MAGGGPQGGGADFFISYTQADRAWAEWIAWTLEEDGHKVLIQAWDFVPGSNWIQGMAVGVRGANRTIAVLSPDYLESQFGTAEWEYAWRSDPDGSERKLLTVRVCECDRPGLLAGVVSTDLFGLDEAAAKAKLRAMVTAAITGRAKPATSPHFPGVGRAVAGEPGFPGRSSVDSPAVQEPVGHAFVSYVREDSDRVNELQRALEAAGIRVWRDTANLWPGQDWRKMIRRAITDDALIFIACFSSQSAARATSYQNEELVLAVEQLRQRQPDVPWLIPVRFDDCQIPDLDIGAGRTLGSIQRADLFGDGCKAQTNRLVTTVQRLLK